MLEGLKCSIVHKERAYIPFAKKCIQVQGNETFIKNKKLAVLSLIYIFLEAKDNVYSVKQTKEINSHA